MVVFPRDRNGAHKREHHSFGSTSERPACDAPGCLLSTRNLLEAAAFIVLASLGWPGSTGMFQGRVA
jgi:hypothetical protein